MTDLDATLLVTAIELGDSASLGADVRIEIDPRVTVLVGRNGAGKSLLVENLYGAARRVVWVVGFEDPGRFALEARHATPPDAPLRYECRWRRFPSDGDADVLARGGLPEEPNVGVAESCNLIDATRTLLWRTGEGRLYRADGSLSEIDPSRTLLSGWMLRRRGSEVELPPSVSALSELLFRVASVGAGIPRTGSVRQELALPFPWNPRTLAEAPRRVDLLAYRLAGWHERDRERFDEFVAIGRRMGLFDETKVKVYRDPDVDPTSSQRRDLVSVLIDGVNLGLASDGTLRVAEILVGLVEPNVSLLLIEEPESAVHPGLLSKLLAEIDAYADDRQIILTTQSPLVVSWAKPRALRLVERTAGQTRVRSFRDNELARVSAFLHDEGSLGDFVYSGALDDEG